MNLNGFKDISGVNVSENFETDNFFEKLYLTARKSENRIYTNDELSRLPEIAATHIHYKEWFVRKNSSERLINYLRDKKIKLDILEIGCGNGWLSNKLAEIKDSNVIGLDINFKELQQAAEVFKKVNLNFIYGNIFENLLNGETSDIIVFAASVQYFSSFKKILNVALKHLKKDGEIHILDTFFYAQKKLTDAKERTKKYYEDLDLPEMNDHYFHHCADELSTFNHKIFYQPSTISNKIFTKNKNLFPWICVKNN